MYKIIVFYFIAFQIFAQNFTKTEIARYTNQAKNVKIIRDNYGVPHVYGKTDADAVFGLLYAQCEDDFKRIEMNFIEKLGRTAEIKGETAIYDDLLIKLLIDSTEAIADYNRAAPYLKKLLNAQADGINYYLFKHPEIKPIIIKKFKPWYHLLWTDGSIGAISTADITIKELKEFYSKHPLSAIKSSTSFQSFKEINATNFDKTPWNEDQTGSNGFAFAPKITEAGSAILYINPHTSFYYRPEVHMISEKGLNTYGAVTWGQMFVYQGFNEYCGWMHTSSNADVADVYSEKIINKNGKLFYEYDKILKPVTKKKISLKYLENGLIKTKEFTTYFTIHGPIMAERNGHWVSLKSYNRSLKSLEQSWLRIKTTGFESYKKVMDIKANTSNNTVFADNQGNIAYWHGNFMPIRDKNYNWGKEVDGTISKTSWKGLHKVEETVHMYNPENGWIQNCNSTPFTCSGIYSPKKENYPNYMAPDGENFRGVNAAKVLSSENKYTLEKVIKAGYNHNLAAFEVLVPALIKRFDESVKPQDSLYLPLKEPIETLRKWDFHAGENSIATTLAIEWAYKLNPDIQKVYIEEGESDQVASTKQFAKIASSSDLILPFYNTIQEFTKSWGNWQIPWGEMNRFQRPNGDISLVYNDSKPSIPVGIASSLWGSLPSFNTRHFEGLKKRYGFNGNSFVCAVQFGPKIIAKSLLAGGNSGDPNSKHFYDQAESYAKGQFKNVNFYKDDVIKNMERTYQPGE